MNLANWKNRRRGPAVAVAVLTSALLLPQAFRVRTACAATFEDDRAKKTITLVYIADLHAQLEPHPELFWSDRGDETAIAGGVARVGFAVQAIRRERPGSVLFMDAGDTFQGSAAAAWTEGKAVVPALNALKLDLAIPGNWEVVYGAQALQSRANELHYPMIASNIRWSDTKKLMFPPYLIKEVNGVRVAVVGFTDPDVPTRQPPSYSRGLTYDDESGLQALIDRVRGEERAEVVLLLTHVGLPKSIGLAERLSGVDAVLSGDTHERTYQPIVRNKTWVVEPGSFGSFLGRLDLTVNEGRVVDRRWELIELRSDRFGEDESIRHIVEETSAPFRSRLDATIGKTEVDLARYSVLETSLDAVLADAIRSATGADAALSNGFRFSPPTLAGPIRESDLWNWYPITTRLKTGKATGKQIREFWERELDHVFAKDPKMLFGGWLPRPSGMKVVFEAGAPKGKRTREIRIGGSLIEDERVYTIAACEREGDAPDTLCRIPHVKDPKVMDMTAHEAVRSYLKSHSPIKNPESGRVRAIDLPQVVRSQAIAK
jgi:2',3'-cyclic-nucleotide 2'-phosphodiesterase (5'-nucleotidase family)